MEVQKKRWLQRKPLKPQLQLIKRKTPKRNSPKKRQVKKLHRKRLNKKQARLKLLPKLLRKFRLLKPFQILKKIRLLNQRIIYQNHKKTKLLQVQRMDQANCWLPNNKRKMLQICFQKLLKIKPHWKNHLKQPQVQRIKSQLKRMC